MKLRTVLPAIVSAAGVLIAAFLCVDRRDEFRFPSRTATTLIDVGERLKSWGFPRLGKAISKSGIRIHTTDFDRAVANGNIIGVAFQHSMGLDGRSNLSVIENKIASAGFMIYASSITQVSAERGVLTIYVDAAGRAFTEAIATNSNATDDHPSPSVRGDEAP